MKTFEEALEEALEERIKEIPYRTYLDVGGYYDGMNYGFDCGVEWASQSPELINEILTKYMEWAYNLPAQQFANWEYEEGDHEKTKARIRKEFIEFINKQNK